MIRRLFRLAVTAFCLMSLLASLGLGWLWWRSYRADDRIARRVRGTWYSLASSRGRLTMFVPPPVVSSPAARNRAADLAAGLRNDQLQWRSDPFHWTGAYPLSVHEEGWVSSRLNTPAETIEGIGPQDSVRPLLDALDDPDRFAAAHFLLSRRTSRPDRWGTNRWDRLPAQGPYGPTWVTFEGMTVELTAPEEYSPLLKYTARADTRQIPALRDHWHQRLDVPVRSMAHWQAGLATALPPLLWVGAWGRRRWVRRGRRIGGLCPACGYDLRATRGRCPECGAVPTPPPSRG